jgi:flagellar hook-associated protein 1 FlgK
MRVLDDGAAGPSDVNAVSAHVTETGLSSGNLELAFFTDSGRVPQDYTGSLDGSPQKRGFASRITFNSALVADPSALVAYSPTTAAGDATRPFFLLDRLNSTDISFSPGTGIGAANAPFTGSIGDYLQRVVDFQAEQSARAERDLAGKELMRDSLQTKMQESTGVNIDQELSELLVLQNAYAANARVLSTVDELLNILLNI